MLAAVLAASTLASCAGESVLDAVEDRERLGAKRDRAAVQQEKTRADKAARSSVTKVKETKSQQESRTQDTRSAPSSAPEQGGAPTGSDKGNSPTTPTNKPKPAEACVSDMAGEMEGSGGPPSYVDLQRGCVHEEGSRIALGATTVSALPARMPDRNTNLAIGFALERPTSQTVYVTAEATDGGWSAYYSRGQGRQDLAAPSVSGNQLSLSLPASALDGARQLTWRVESSWLRSTRTSTSYAFDDAPNGSSAAFGRG